MTREEARRILQGAIKKPNTKDGYLGQALDIAIKALEQEPCEDAVSRQAVRDVIFAECSSIKLDIDFAKVLLLQRAIKALPPVTPKCRCSEKPNKSEIPTSSTTKNDLAVDCIDRQATLDAIIERLGIRNESYLLEAERVLYQQIKDMPSVTPYEPKTGHWIHLPHNKARCSECDDVVLIAQMYGNANYCPNCGAKMDDEQKSEEQE